MICSCLSTTGPPCPVNVFDYAQTDGCHARPNLTTKGLTSYCLSFSSLQWTVVSRPLYLKRNINNFWIRLYLLYAIDNQLNFTASVEKLDGCQFDSHLGERVILILFHHSARNVWKTWGRAGFLCVKWWNINKFYLITYILTLIINFTYIAQYQLTIRNRNHRRLKKFFKLYVNKEGSRVLYVYFVLR